MARGQDDSLNLSCTTLAFATPSRFIPALSGISLLSGAQQTSGSVENQHSTSKTFGVRPKIDSPGNVNSSPRAVFLFLVTRSFFPNQFVFHTFAM
jgi:hypothetical protein